MLPIRSTQRVNYLGRPVTWHEMEHPGEGHRDLTKDILDVFIVDHRWRDLIRPDMTCIDIGAHSGDTTIAMMLLGGTVLAIEPNPYIRPYLEQCLADNQHLGSYAISDHAITTGPGPVTIWDHRNAMCNGGLHDPVWGPELEARIKGMSGQSVTVPGDTLQSVCKHLLTEREYNTIGFIKTDTEGHDVSILESSQVMIQELRPVIFMEWFFAYGERENDRMFQVIDQLDYVALDPATLLPWTERTSDLVLVPREHRLA